MAEDIEQIVELQNEVKELNKAVSKAIDLNLTLQKKVSDLNEDTFLNAKHINLLKTGNVEYMDKNNTILKEQLKSNIALVEGLEEDTEKKSANNYTKFIKSLLESDFKAIQNELVEDVRRQFTKNKGKPIQQKQSGSKINIIFNIMSLVSFVFLVYICFKYNLLK